MATGGFGTEAAKKTDSGLKDKVGGAAYAITGELCQHSLQPQVRWGMESVRGGGWGGPVRTLVGGGKDTGLHSLGAASALEW